MALLRAVAPHASSYNDRRPMACNFIWVTLIDAASLASVSFPLSQYNPEPKEEPWRL